jgi:hypothetical protein
MNTRLKKQSQEKNLVQEAKKEINDMVKSHKNKEYQNYLDRK